MASDFKLILEPGILHPRLSPRDHRRPAGGGRRGPFRTWNELTRDLDGKLFPLGIVKMLYRLKVKGPKSARLLILGIRQKYRHVRKYAGLSAFLYAELNDSGKALGIEWGELGWTLEDNGPVNAGIRMMGAKQYKRYRVYDRALASS